MTTPTGILFTDPQVKPLSTIGLFQAGAYLYFYLTGTTTQTDVYADGALTTPLSQPVTADSAGRFVPIYLDSATVYRVQMFTSLGVKVEDTDPYVVPFGGYASQTFTGGATDIGSIQLTRNADYSGGTPGFTNSVLYVIDNVGTAVAADEWAITSVLNNSATGGENVAIYGQGNRVTGVTGPTWGGVFEVRDQSGLSDPTVGLVGLEVDCRASGTDANSNRIGVDVFITRYPEGSGTAMQAWCGVRVNNDGDASATVINCFAVAASVFDNAFVVLPGAAGVWGLNLGAGTYSSGAINMPQGAPICFEASGVTAMYWDGTGLRFDWGTSSSSRSQQLRFVPGSFAGDGGGLAIAGSLGVNGVACAAQPTGYGTPTGGSHQSSFAAGSISLGNLAAAVAQLIIDLKATGLIAT